MLTDREYAEAIVRGKGFQRAHVVQVVFQGQDALARQMGVSRSFINHLVHLRRRSSRIESFVLQKVRELRPDLVQLWEPHWRRNGKKKAA